MVTLYLCCVRVATEDKGCDPCVVLHATLDWHEAVRFNRGQRGDYPGRAYFVQEFGLDLERAKDPLNDDDWDSNDEQIEALKDALLKARSESR